MSFFGFQSCDHVCEIENRKSSFSQTRKVGNVGIIVNFVLPFLHQFSFSFVPTNVSECKIRNQGVTISFKGYTHTLNGTTCFYC